MEDGPSFFQKAAFEHFGSFVVFQTGGCQEYMVFVEI
jgi:hypothetical protein